MEKLKMIFASVLNLPQEKITPELSPENTPAWDSLNAIILVTEIEKAFNIKFTFNDVMSVKNFGDAKKLVAEKGADPDAT
jgi:acyl carrier protein